IARIVELFQNAAGIAEVLIGRQRQKYAIDHERAGDVVLISSPNSWQAYYYWLDDAKSPKFARTVDIHRKPGYDPVELHFDFATKSIPLNASLVRGSHGAPAVTAAQQTVLLASRPVLNGKSVLKDTDVCAVVLKEFGVS